MSTLGEKLRRLRKENNLTLDQLAELTGTSKSYLWELENRDVSKPSADKLNKLAASLGTTLNYLLDEEGKVTEEDANDEGFYRKYRAKPKETKERIRRMLDLWDQDE